MLLTQSTYVVNHRGIKPFQNERKVNMSNDLSACASIQMNTALLKFLEIRLGRFAG